MCGIALLVGRELEELDETLQRLAHRGPDEQDCWSNDSLSIGFVRLAINDEEYGAQPYLFKDYVGAFNGEIYNYSELLKSYNIKLHSKCDTHCILPLFDLLGTAILGKLDGFYSGIIYNKKRQCLYLLRDYIGKKPLFHGMSEGRLFVVSELKAVQSIQWFKHVPKGLSSLDLNTGELKVIAKHSVKSKSKANLYKIMERSVLKRIPHQHFGIFLSGGLDSSIIAALAQPLDRDITYYTLGNADNVDTRAVKELAQELNISKVSYIPLPKEEELSSLIREVVYATESYNPSIVSNGLASYLLAREARRDNLKVVLTGEGADELFGGYYPYLSPRELVDKRSELIAYMHRTELRRLDSCTMAHSIEARCPFLDQELKGLSDSLAHEDIYADGENKVILRKCFEKVLPKDILRRKKTSFDVGSGIRKLVVEHLTKEGRSEIESLRLIWESLFAYKTNNPYFYSYPSFDAAIARRGIIPKT